MKHALDIYGNNFYTINVTTWVTAPERSDRMTIKLKEIRKDRKLTQEELAKVSGVTRQTIIRIEKEQCKEVTVKTLLLLSDALKCSISDLLCP